MIRGRQGETGAFKKPLRERTRVTTTVETRTAQQTTQVSEQLLRVMDQVRTIKESTQATNGLLMDRIEDAFSDIQR